MDYDVLIIGAGPGGYVAAIRAAQLGLKTACVERWLDDAGKPALGGACLNVGCIPSKALLDSSHAYEHIIQQSKEHGITVGDVSLDVAAMQKRKDKVVRTLTQGIAGLFRKHGVEWLQGHARLLGGNQVAIVPVNDASEEKTVSADNIIIATGAAPATIPQAAIDNDRIVDSTGALAFTEVPPRLGIIGAGVIGLELGTVWRRLGSQVILLEALSDFLPSADTQIAHEAFKVFKKQGLDIRLETKVTSAISTGQEVNIEFESQGSTQSITVDKLVVAVGRKPVTDNLGLATAGVHLNPSGFIQVDEFGRTNIPHIYAIGDVVGGPMLAHKASEEGVAVAEHIAGQKSRIDHETVPWVIYTWPEIAWVGQTEQALKSEGRNYRAGVFPFLASGRARALGETAGLVKILGDAETDRLLGVHIFGPNASELIAEAVLAMEFAASTEDIARTIHAHPTLAEALHEAALAADGRAVHM
jgi:dihydrolipoamide dehydrogenase